MRTTLNIDDALLRRLKREAEIRGQSLTEIVNRVLQLGVARLHPESRREAYQCPRFSMGFPPVGNPDKALALAAALEDEETVRKLQLRK